MQGDNCAYCKRPLGKGLRGRHVEHFVRKGRVPAGTFKWENLLWSCEDTQTCGHFKDQKAKGTYSDADLVKPDVDDPRDFFAYRLNGKIIARPTATAAAQFRASKTIRVFNLNPYKHALQAWRVTGFKSLVREIEELQGLMADPELRPLLEVEVDELLARAGRAEFVGCTAWLVREVLGVG